MSLAFNRILVDEGEIPEVELVGADGNAYAILGLCREAAKKADWDQERIEDFTDEAMNGDYDHLLQTVALCFDIV